jgi:hypothetical protein
LYLILLLELVLRSELLREAALLRPEELKVLVLVGSLMERDAVILLVGVVLVVAGRWALDLEAEEDFATCWLFWLPAPDLPLFLGAFFAMMGSENSIKAKVIVTKPILAFFRYLSIDIIHLLSSAIVSGRQNKLFTRRSPADPILRLFTLEQVRLKLLLYLLKAATWGPVTNIPPQNHYFFSSQEGPSG